MVTVWIIFDQYLQKSLTVLNIWLLSWRPLFDMIPMRPIGSRFMFGIATKCGIKKGSDTHAHIRKQVQKMYFQ